MKFAVAISRGGGISFNTAGWAAEIFSSLLSEIILKRLHFNKKNFPVN